MVKDANRGFIGMEGESLHTTIESDIVNSTAEILEKEYKVDPELTERLRRAVSSTDTVISILQKEVRLYENLLSFYAPSAIEEIRSHRRGIFFKD